MKTKFKKILKYFLMAVGVLAIAIGGLIYYETRNGMYGTVYIAEDNLINTYEGGQSVEAGGVQYKPTDIETVVYKGKKVLRLELVVKLIDTDSKFIFDPKDLTLHNGLDYYPELLKDEENLEVVSLPYWGDEKRYVMFEAPDEYAGSAYVLEINNENYPMGNISYVLKLDAEEDD